MIKLFAASNLLQAERPYFLRLLQKFVRTKYDKNFSARLDVERLRVAEEIEVIAKASAERIAKAQGK